MLDDIDQEICNNKHYGPVLHEEAGFQVMRCSFCEKIFKSPCQSNNESEPKKKSSKSCIQDCDWYKKENMVNCKSCGYTGPLP